MRLKKEGSFVYSDASELFQTDLNTFILLDKLPDFVNNKVEKSDNELFVILEVLLLGWSHTFVQIDLSYRNYWGLMLTDLWLYHICLTRYFSPQSRRRESVGYKL